MELLLQAAQVLELEQADSGSVTLHGTAVRVSVAAPAAGQDSLQQASSKSDNQSSPPCQCRGDVNRQQTTELDRHSRRLVGLATREVHNQLEKNRRKQLREFVSHLQQCVPSLENKRVATQSILQGAIKHIKNLRKKDVEQEKEIQMLAKRKSELKKKFDLEFNQCTEEQQQGAKLWLAMVRSQANPDTTGEAGNISATRGNGSKPNTRETGNTHTRVKMTPIEQRLLKSQVDIKVTEPEDSSDSTSTASEGSTGEQVRDRGTPVSWLTEMENNSEVNQPPHSKSTSSSGLKGEESVSWASGQPFVSPSSQALKLMLQQRNKHQTPGSSVPPPADVPMSYLTGQHEGSLTYSHPIISTHLTSAIRSRPARTTVSQTTHSHSRTTVSQTTHSHASSIKPSITLSEPQPHHGVSQNAARIAAVTTFTEDENQTVFSIHPQLTNNQMRQIQHLSKSSNDNLQADLTCLVQNSPVIQHGPHTMLVNTGIRPDQPINSACSSPDFGLQIPGCLPAASRSNVSSATNSPDHVVTPATHSPDRVVTPATHSPTQLVSPSDITSCRSVEAMMLPTLFHLPLCPVFQSVPVVRPNLLQIAPQASIPATSCQAPTSTSASDVLSSASCISKLQQAHNSHLLLATASQTTGSEARITRLATPVSSFRASTNVMNTPILLTHRQPTMFSSSTGNIPAGQVKLVPLSHSVNTSTHQSVILSSTPLRFITPFPSSIMTNTLTNGQQPLLSTTMTNGQHSLLSSVVQLDSTAPANVLQNIIPGHFQVQNSHQMLTRPLLILSAPHLVSPVTAPTVSSD